MMNDLEIAFTAKEITAFGGVSLLYKMLDNCHFKEALSSVGLPQQGSNRGKSPEQLIYGLFTGVWCGASCYNHLDIVRFDPTLCHLMGYEKGPDHRAYQRYFNKFSQAVNQCVFDSLYSWFFSELCFDNYTLDFDSTVMERCGEQEGAAVGYNPKRPGRKSHHPLLAFVADLRMIANYWLRPGNTSASTNYLAFLDNTLDRLQGKKVGLVRMDSGFFSGEIFDRLEEKRLSYIVACRFNNSIKIQLASQAKWTEVADGIHIAESTYQAQDWKKPRRIIMVRQEIDKRPKAAGKKIKKIKNSKQLELFPDVAELGNYRYSCFITSLTLPAKASTTSIAEGLTLRTESRKSSTTSLLTSSLPKTSGLPKPATPLLSWHTTSSVSSGMLSSIPRRVISLRPSGTRYSVFLPISKRREIKMFYVL